ncbi:hypothetical protein QJS04_geneDACA007326 [Acorus gramineus]|uniref:Uncharacterized protein n=1 Tax=Acorus gramineus TaxID=55184 RepID=A0AAV9BQQ1_ACOGR|nr:hypothetical protein QJS04_geneDACA007326 [Acorus gramineus]
MRSKTNLLVEIGVSLSRAYAGRSRSRPNQVVGVEYGRPDLRLLVGLAGCGDDRANGDAAEHAQLLLRFANVRRRVTSQVMKTNFVFLRAP